MEKIYERIPLVLTWLSVTIWVYKDTGAGEEMGVAEKGLNGKLHKYFPGRVVRKDLTQRLRRGKMSGLCAGVFLLGMYCATDDEKALKTGKKSETILAENFVRPDEAER